MRRRARRLRHGGIGASIRAGHAAYYFRRGSACFVASHNALNSARKCLYFFFLSASIASASISARLTSCLDYGGAAPLSDLLGYGSRRHAGGAARVGVRLISRRGHFARAADADFATFRFRSRHRWPICLRAFEPSCHFPPFFPRDFVSARAIGAGARFLRR